MAIEREHLRLLRRAVRAIRARDIEHYFDLRDLLSSNKAFDRDAFEERFAKYYRLRSAFLGNAVERRFFDLLFIVKRRRPKDPYSRVLLDLVKIKTLKRKHLLHFSFASKLVSIHDEAQPLYDRHVREFFGLMPPGIGNAKFRIAGFVKNLESVRRTYEEWSADPAFARLVAPLYRRFPQLKECHSSRICDFMVWAVGNQKLWKKSART
jgi:hypothetical protein